MGFFSGLFSKKRSAAIVPALTKLDVKASDSPKPTTKIATIVMKSKVKPAPIDAKQLVQAIFEVVVSYQLRINPVPRANEWRATHQLKRLFSCNGQKFFCGATGRARAAQFNLRLTVPNKPDGERLKDVCNYAYQEHIKAADSWLTRRIFETVATKLGMQRMPSDADGVHYLAHAPGFAVIPTTAAEFDSHFYDRVKNEVIRRVDAHVDPKKDEKDEKQALSRLSLTGRTA